MSPDATATKQNTGIQYTCKSYNIASNLCIIKYFFKKNHFFLKLLRFQIFLPVIMSLLVVERRPET